MSAPKQSDRILSGSITVGDSEPVELTAESHKSILSALMNLTTSSVGNTDALASAEIIAEFISDIKVSDLAEYTFTISDQVKEVSFNGLNLNQLVKVWGLVETRWLVSRGGKREVEPRKIVKLNQLTK